MDRCRFPWPGPVIVVIIVITVTVILSLIAYYKLGGSQGTGNLCASLSILFVNLKLH